MRKLLLLAAGAVGYVLGARAGRQRYDQLKDAFDKLKNDPRVQEKAHQAADFAAEKAPVVVDKVSGAVSSASSAAAAKVGRSGGSGETGKDAEKGADLNPDRLKVGEDTGPRGDLP